jgi:hypothetical protein
MDLRTTPITLARITALRRHLMNLSDAFESGTAATKPALAQTIGICLIEMRVEIDEYLLALEKQPSVSGQAHAAPVVQQ